MKAAYAIGLLCLLIGQVSDRAESAGKVSPESFPGILGRQVTERQGELLMRLGISENESPGGSRVGPIYCRTVDLDCDGHEDGLVTVLVDGPAGARGRRTAHLTYVLKGHDRGSFDPCGKNPVWLSLVSFDGVNHVDYDQETHRKFSLKMQEGQWTVTVDEFRYANDGGEAGERVLTFREHSRTSKTLAAAAEEGEAACRQMIREFNLTR